MCTCMIPVNGNIVSIIRFLHMCPSGSRKLFLSGLAEPQNHPAVKQKTYITIPVFPLSPSNKKNGIHRPVRSLGAFYIFQIVSSSVGARPGSPNLAGLGSQASGSLGPAHLVLPSVGYIQTPSMYTTRAFLSWAQISADADTLCPDTDSVGKITRPSKSVLRLGSWGSTIPVQPLILFIQLQPFVGNHSLPISITDIGAASAEQAGRNTSSVSHIFADNCEYLRAEMVFNLKLAKRYQPRANGISSGSAAMEYWAQLEIGLSL